MTRKELPCSPPPAALTRGFALLAPLALADAARADFLRDGFALSPQWNAPGAQVTLSGGDIVAFDGDSIDRFTAGGAFVGTLGTFPAPVFSGAIAIDPTETFLLFGESSNGDMFRVALDGSGMTFLANVFFNFDAVFETPTTALVSAATAGFGMGNDLVRLDTTSGATSLVAHVAGPSGPVALDAMGNLWYAPQSDLFPPPDGFATIGFYTKAQLESGALLGDADRIPFASGFDSVGSMVFDPVGGGLYVTSNHFGNGTNRIYRVGTSAANSTLLFTGDTWHWVSGLEFVGGDGLAAFQRFQPASGGTLRFSRTDFGALDERWELEPARAQASLSGPGTSGQGEVSLDVAGALPGGTVLVLFAPSALSNPVEQVYSFAGLPPIHSPLHLPALDFLPLFLPADGNGAGSFSFWNPGGLEGLLDFQALVGDAAGTTLGITTAASL